MLEHNEFQPLTLLKYSINFYNPPVWGPMVKEGKDGCYLCVTEPLKCLISAVHRTSDYSFILNIKDEVRTLPAEFNPLCKVCILVHWLLMKCQNGKECYEALNKESLSTVFEVNREIWTRIYPRPIYLSKIFMNFSERFDFAGFFYTPGFAENPELYLSTEMNIRRQFFYAWRNALSYLGHRSMYYRFPRSALNGGFILNGMLSVLRKLMLNKHKELRPMVANMPVYMLDACLLFPDLKELIMKVSQLVGSSICAIQLKPEFWPTITSTFRPKNTMFQESDYYQKAVARGIAALFFLNNRTIFKINKNIRLTYIHLPGCAKNKNDNCICKFAYWLEKNEGKFLPTQL